MSVIRAFSMRFDVPKTAKMERRDLEDLTTAPLRDAGGLSEDALHIAPPRSLWTPIERPAPGRLVRGTHGADHQGRFLLRLPRDWNGRLVVAASSGITDETTYDLYFSDYFLSRGYAFGVTDKGVRRAVLDGDTVLMPLIPENSIRRWAERLDDLALTARAEAAGYYGRQPERTYAVGLSNGGYVARRAAESDRGLYDGAVEISGVMWRADEGGLLREVPAALRATASQPWDREALRGAGFPCDDRGWDQVLALYRALYWEAVVRLFAGDLDPAYEGPTESYDLDARPAEVREAIRSFENTGDLRVPLVSVAGGRDLLINCAGHALAYRDLVAARGKSALHELVLVEQACHIDTNHGLFPFIEPLMPHAHAAFEALVERVEGERATAPSSRRRR
jgi:hypothetical protein